MSIKPKENLEIILECSPVYELVLSLRAYLNKKDRKILELGKDRVKQIDEQLSPEIKEIMESERDFLLQQCDIISLVYLCPTKESVSGFLEWLRQDSECFKKLHQFILDESGHSAVQTCDLNGLKDRIVTIWEGWYKQYFANVEEKITAELNRSLSEKKEWMGKLSAIEIIERLTNGMYLEDTNADQIILIPQVHFSPFNIYTQLNVGEQLKQFYCYPIDLQASADEPAPRLLRIVKCISDPNRLKTLRFLYQTEKSFTEIVQHLGLAKSTVHHHVVMLRAAGLVRYHISDTKGTRYSLRETRIREISDVIHEYVTR
ncbi:ArsR/SmtB family transcription factor [Bacillus horti]|uniref:DNA-binding transcriptional ArsR family regulator n=1 Tax=Caldalkalibacillus horti TaxID=77523 RepID=A0ABT9W2R0_9BACI|nr:metalloregulator ArsR/SmtB family transcription factor [Bacillus horti]MDQ0167532.1 DNA-binding transcriptional ArsR family regulator [Bacillus horti]